MSSFLAENTPVTDIKPDPVVDAIVERVPGLERNLCSVLYGRDAPTNTFLLIDATLRANIVGIFDLDTLKRPALCLFDGDAAEQYSDSAPWLTDLSIADPVEDDLHFHADFFENHWPAQTSVLIQSEASLAEIKNHLRRFVQLPVLDDGKRRFFRFWDGRILPDFLRSIFFDGPRARRMTVTDQNTAISYTCLTPKGPISIVPNMDSVTKQPIKAMHLEFADFDASARAEKEARYVRIASRIMNDFDGHLGDKNLEDVTQIVRAAAQRFGGFGFREHAHLHFFAVWSVLYGLGFEQADNTGKLQEICRSQAPEKERFQAFRNWFDTFTVAA